MSLSAELIQILLSIQLEFFFCSNYIQSNWNNSIAFNIILYLKWNTFHSSHVTQHKSCACSMELSKGFYTIRPSSHLLFQLFLRKSRKFPPKRFTHFVSTIFLLSIPPKILNFYRRWTQNYLRFIFVSGGPQIYSDKDRT